MMPNYMTDNFEPWQMYVTWKNGETQRITHGSWMGSEQGIGENPVTYGNFMVPLNEEMKGGKSMDDIWSGLAYLLSELILKYSSQIDFDKLREMDEMKNDNNDEIAILETIAVNVERLENYEEKAQQCDVQRKKNNELE